MHRSFVLCYSSFPNEFHSIISVNYTVHPVKIPAHNRIFRLYINTEETQWRESSPEKGIYVSPDASRSYEGLMMPDWCG